MTRALIFDMDGVLINNTAYQARAFQALFTDLGLTTNARKLLDRLNGMPAPDILRHVFRQPVPLKQRKEYAAQREFLYRTLYRGHRQETPGLSAFLTAARGSGLRLGLGTGSPSETISFIIDHLDLRRLFDVVVGADEVKRGKPHPDTFLAVARKLGVAPAECVVFEDAVLGEQAATRAGMPFVGVTATLPAAAFKKPLAVIKDFRELTVPGLLALG